MNLKTMLMKNKKIVLIIAVVIIAIISALIMFTLNDNSDNKKIDENPKQKEKVESKVKENKNKNVIKEQIVDGIKISDVKVEIINGLTTFTAKATNTTENPINFKGVDIHVKGNVEVTLGAYGFSVINPGETLDLINYSDVDLEKAKEVTYSIAY